MDELDQLRQLGPMMEGLRINRSATLHYHVMADALLWSDEIPGKIDPEADDALRCLLRYRTSLILGKPEEEWRHFWDAGRVAFPNWIGFLSERSTPNQKLTNFYYRAVAQSDQEIDELLG